MLELHQFHHSPFCRKVRMCLQAKRLSFRTVEITPGMGQVDVFKLSGQRKVPVLLDGENVLSDSSAIIRYIEKLHPHPNLIPSNPEEMALVHLIEDWADTTLANSCLLAFLEAASIDPELRMALVPREFPDPIRNLVRKAPLGFLNSLTELFVPGDRPNLLESLQRISCLLDSRHWVVGDSMTVADLAIAAQLSLLSFPNSNEASFPGKGVSGLWDHPSLESLFIWRDQLELALLSNRES